MISFMSILLFACRWHETFIHQHANETKWIHCTRGFVTLQSLLARINLVKGHARRNRWRRGEESRLANVIEKKVFYSVDLFHASSQICFIIVESVFLIPRTQRAKLEDFARKPRKEATKRVMSSRKSFFSMFFMSWEMRKVGRSKFLLSKLPKATFWLNLRKISFLLVSAVAQPAWSMLAPRGLVLNFAPMNKRKGIKICKAKVLPPQTSLS